MYRACALRGFSLFSVTTVTTFIYKYKNTLKCKIYTTKNAYTPVYAYNVAHGCLVTF